MIYERSYDYYKPTYKTLLQPFLHKAVTSSNTLKFLEYRAILKHAIQLYITSSKGILHPHDHMGNMQNDGEEK